MDGFIVGGSLAKILEFPHMAFLEVIQQHDGDNSAFICGSSILNQALVLTAAHCFDPCKNFQCSVAVYIGHKNRAKGKRIMVDFSRKHEKYSTQDVHHDIALVRLRQNIKFSDSIQRVALMKERPNDNLAYITGWGIVDEDYKEHTLLLKKAQQTVYSREQCLHTLPDIPTGTICAGNDDEFASSGDSGGPLVVKGYIQIGLVSFKRPDISSSLVVYTDVGYYNDWIQLHAQSLYCHKKKRKLADQANATSDCYFDRLHLVDSDSYVQMY